MLVELVAVAPDRAGAMNLVARILARNASGRDLRATAAA
jgi:hypothetical protein